MSKSHDKLLDRLLGFAPWAAAILVGLCFVALVARVAMNAGSASERTAALASATETEMAPGERAKTQGGTESATALEGRRTDPAGASAFPVRRSLNEAQTPSSKSRLEIHGVRGGLLAGGSVQKSTDRLTVGTADDSRPVDRASSSAGDPPTASALDVISGGGSRAPSPDGQAHTSFFGLEAFGRRFVYVLDRSGSMGDPDNKPLRAAKEELLSSLSRLGDVHQFFLIFYNEEPVVFRPTRAGRQLVFADDLNKHSARRFVESIQAHGGTKHYEALSKAIALRPDVIFLLTDGEPKDDLADDELARLERLNGGLAQIHVVQFASSPYAGNSLVKLANENRGQHTYKDFRELAGKITPGP